MDRYWREHRVMPLHKEPIKVLRGIAKGENLSEKLLLERRRYS